MKIHQESVVLQSGSVGLGTTRPNPNQKHNIQTISVCLGERFSWEAGGLERFRIKKIIRICINIESQKQEISNPKEE